MPFGVDHCVAVTALEGKRQLSQPLMPFGVDHPKQLAIAEENGLLSQPLMPFGVEHKRGTFAMDTGIVCPNL